MVKDYQSALSIAKEFNVTCVTPDLQVVYGGAYITKVGSSRNSNENRVTLYFKISQH